MTTTDHEAEALHILGLSIPVTSDTEAVVAMMESQVHATLALAAEQRTANLLTYLALVPPHSATRDRLLDEIHARLDPSIDEEDAR